MTVTLRRLLPILAFLLACRVGAPDFPETPLGHVGHDWLAAHNRAEGHAFVHFTTLNRGRATMSGAQMDSAVYAGVQRARHIGRLVPVRLLYSSDTTLVMLLRSADSSVWSARFTRAVQPSLEKVAVAVERVHAAGEAVVTTRPDSNPR